MAPGGATMLTAWFSSGVIIVGSRFVVCITWKEGHNLHDMCADYSQIKIKVIFSQAFYPF